MKRRDNSHVWATRWHNMRPGSIGRIGFIENSIKYIQVFKGDWK